MEFKLEGLVGSSVNDLMSKTNTDSVVTFDALNEHILNGAPYLNK